MASQDDLVVTRSTVLATDPASVFALLADPSKHSEVDGSGSVKGAVKGPHTLSQGATFGMKMKLGVPYTIKNTVVEFEPDRSIAWRHLGRHVWRWELEPVAGGTKVTESVDYRPSPLKAVLGRVGMIAKMTSAIEGSLRRLEERFGTV